jgi:deferrochelatase/peroxidase EfeB
VLGANPTNAMMFAGGLLFLAFMRDPARQFVPVQRRLAQRDPLSTFARHTGSAIFAIPPGARPGGFVGEGLLDAG